MSDYQLNSQLRLPQLQVVVGKFMNSVAKIVPKLVYFSPILWGVRFF